VTTRTSPRRPVSARPSIPVQQNFRGSFMAPRPAPTKQAPKQAPRAQLTGEAAQQRAARERPASAREYNRWETTTNTFYVDFVKTGKVKNWPQFQSEGTRVDRLEEERMKMMEQLAKHPADLAQEFKAMTFQSDIFHKTPLPGGEPKLRLEPTLRASDLSPLQPGKPRWRK